MPHTPALHRPWRPYLILTAALGAAALAWDLAGLDLPVMRVLGTAQGFALRHHPLLERVLHDGLRQLATLLLLAVLGILALAPGGVRRLPAPQRAALGLGLLLALYAVNLIKRHSLTSCPWDLQAFGGAAQYVSHWAWGVADGGPGRCFPGGHASSLASLLPLALPALAAPATAVRSRQRGLRWLAALLVASLLTGLVQTLRGAHHPSHTLWTLWLCWTAGGAPLVLLGHWQATPTLAPCPGTPNSTSTTSPATATRC